jgi:putative NIF3 family GTP cyclohydrolase 1 type 2
MMSPTRAVVDRLVAACGRASSQWCRCRLAGRAHHTSRCRAAQKLAARSIRVVGDPALPVKRVAASWGYTSLMPGAPTFARPDVDVLIVGEAREWELVEYAQDAIRSGQKKALIVLGHVLSEQAGMKYCAEWLHGFVPEVPVEFVAAAEPFWSPGRPVG